MKEKLRFLGLDVHAETIAVAMKVTHRGVQAIPRINSKKRAHTAR